jgi:putative transposase
VRGKFGELPSTTSSNTDSRPDRAPAERAIACDIDHDEICTLFYRSLAKINTRISGGVLNQTPIEVMINYFKSAHKPLLRRLPLVSAANPEVGVIAVRTHVRRRSEKNANLYVGHSTNKYTNAVLAKRADLLGEEIIIHVAPNLQSVNAFEVSGFPLGKLIADGIWGKTAHTRDIKRAVNRDVSLRYMQHPDNLNPIQGLMQKKAMQVLQKNEKRTKGGVVKGALILQDMMQATKTEELQVNTDIAPTIETNRTLTTAVERAKKAQKVRERLRLERSDATGK